MVQAAVRRVVDFTRRDPHDGRWWIGTNILLHRLAQENRLELIRLAHASNVATASRENLEPRSYSELADQRQSLREDVVEILLPWLGRKTRETQRETAFNALQESWAAAFGDQNDPETQRKIEMTVAALNKLERSHMVHP